MKIVAFLQCQWFKDPARMAIILEHYERREEEGRERFIRDFLFFGCLTGQRLLKAFGDDLRWQIVWEEASRGLHGKASAAPPADPEHMRAVLTKHQPDVVLLFGRIAQAGWEQVAGKVGTCRTLYGPHPAARHASVMNDLRAMAKALQEMMG